MTIYFRLATLCVGSLALYGVSTSAVAEPATQQRQVFPIKILDKDLGAMEFPGGEYRVPDSQVMITGLQRAIRDFILGTVSTENSLDKSAASDVTKALQIRASDLAETITRELISTPELSGKFSEASSDAQPVLTIQTAILLTYVNDTDLEPSAVVRAKFNGAGNKSSKWNRRYFATSAKPLPLTGESSWTSDGGAALRAVVSGDLRRAIKFMLEDIDKPAPRNKYMLTAVEAHFPYMKNRYKLLGFLLREDESFIYYQPDMSDGWVFSDVQILPKESIKYRPAVMGDPRRREVRPVKPAAEGG